MMELGPTTKQMVLVVTTMSMEPSIVYIFLTLFPLTYLVVLTYIYLQLIGGMWKDDLQNGEGFEKWSDGSAYFGWYENGKKSGVGLYKWSDGS